MAVNSCFFEIFFQTESFQFHCISECLQPFDLHRPLSNQYFRIIELNQTVQFAAEMLRAATYSIFFKVLALENGTLSHKFILKKLAHILFCKW